MAAFPNDTFYAPGKSYYLKAGEALTLPNPLDVIDDTGTFVTEIDTQAVGGVIVGQSTLALKTSGGTLLSELTLTANTSSSASALNVNVGQPGAVSTLVVDGNLGVQTYAPVTIFDTATAAAMEITSTQISSAMGSGIKLGLPTMSLNTNVSIDQVGSIVATKPGGGVNAALTPDDLTFTGASATAKMGTTGTSAYFGFGTAPFDVPAVLVDINQSATIQFSDGTNKGAIQMSGSNVIIGSTAVPNAISIDPTGIVDIPNLTYPSTLTAIYGNFTSNVNTPSLNGNLLANTIHYADTFLNNVSTAGSPGVWILLASIPVILDLVRLPSMDFHTPPIVIAPNNPPNFNWEGGIGVIGNNFGSVPGVFKTYRGTINGGDCIGGDCFLLRNGVDYDSTTINLDIYVIGYQNDPEFATLNGVTNIQMRGYPF